MSDPLFLISTDLEEAMKVEHKAHIHGGHMYGCSMPKGLRGLRQKDTYVALNSLSVY